MGASVITVRFESCSHVPDRTTGMADLLSRHPSPCEGTIASAERLFNVWFTVNVVRDLEKNFENSFHKKRQPIKIEPTRVSESRAKG